jgi:hypothetical protein
MRKASIHISELATPNGTVGLTVIAELKWETQGYATAEGHHN